MGGVSSFHCNCAREGNNSPPRAHRRTHFHFPMIGCGKERLTVLLSNLPGSTEGIVSPLSVTLFSPRSYSVANQLSMNSASEGRGAKLNNDVSTAASFDLVDLLRRRDRSKQIAETISLDCKRHFAAGGNDNNCEGAKFKEDDKTKDAPSLDQELTTRLDTISTKRRELSILIEKVRCQLQELTQQDHALAKEEKEVGVQLKRLRKQSDVGVTILEELEDNTESDSKITLDEELRRAVDKLRHLQSKTPDNRDVPTCDPLNMDTDMTLSNALHAKFLNYLNKCRSYFRTEAECVEYIRNRLSSIKIEVSDLECEIKAFLSLEMKNNLENMKNRLSMLKSHMEEDTNVIDFFKRDVMEMREDLICRVDEYCAVIQNKAEGNNGAGDNDTINNEFWSAQIDTLERIYIDLTSIGMYDDKQKELGSSITSHIGDITISPDTANDILA